MKRYKITYWLGDRSRPTLLAEVCQLERLGGKKVAFYKNGKMQWQDNWKNDLLNGIEKAWFGSPKQIFYKNWKKGKTQGIKFSFR